MTAHFSQMSATENVIGWMCKDITIEMNPLRRLRLLKGYIYQSYTPLQSKQLQWFSIVNSRGTVVRHVHQRHENTRINISSSTQGNIGNPIKP
jgi:hypothetical protein